MDVVTIVCAHDFWDSLLHTIVYAWAISVRGQTVCLTTTLLLRIQMSRYTREYGQASSWYNRDWAPPGKPHTKNSFSGWSKRATRGYLSDYDDRSRQWEDSKPSGSTKDIEGATEVATEQRLRSSRAVTGITDVPLLDNAVSVTQASTTCDSTMALATKKDAVRSRLGELHRLLNNRKGSLSATYKRTPKQITGPTT